MTDCVLILFDEVFKVGDYRFFEVGNTIKKGPHQLNCQ